MVWFGSYFTRIRTSVKSYYQIIKSCRDTGDMEGKVVDILVFLAGPPHTEWDECVHVLLLCKLSRRWSTVWQMVRMSDNKEGKKCVVWHMHMYSQDASAWHDSHKHLEANGMPVKFGNGWTIPVWATWRLCPFLWGSMSCNKEEFKTRVVKTWNLGVRSRWPGVL